MKNLKDTEGIKEYHAKFELIRARIQMSEEYLLSAYLAGLRLDTQMHIRMLRPQTTRQCLVLGRLYEQAHPWKMVTSGWSGAKNQGGNHVTKGFASVTKDGDNKGVIKQKENNQPLRKFLTSAEMSDRRAKGLCYYCDEKYTPEHYLKHKKTQLFLLEYDEMEDKQMELIEELTDEVLDNTAIAQISINAVAGSTDYTTMRVRGTHGKRSLYILIDTGSTHNFMDQRIAKLLGCRVQQSKRSKVSVADGSKIDIEGRIEGFEWYFQQHAFQDDLMVIPLGGHDMVLGVQWLEKFGPITWDFQNLEMKFKWDNKNITLHGLKQGSVREVKAKRLENMKDNDIQLHMVFSYEAEEFEEVMLKAIEVQENEKSCDVSVEKLLEEFKEVFDEPTQLPPFRVNHNHQI